MKQSLVRLAPLVRLATAFVPLALAITACSEPIAKNAHDDRTDGPGVDPGTAQVGVPVGQSGPARCTEASATTERQPVYILFAISARASMAEEYKWQAVTESVNLIIDQVVDSKSIAMGMVVFADQKDPTGNTAPDYVYGPYPTSADVPIRYVDANQAAALKARLQTNPTSSSLAPTQAALEGGYTTLHSFTPSAPLAYGGEKVLVLISSGLPIGNPGHKEDQLQQVTNSLKMAYDNATGADPILTFAVNVGPFPGYEYEDPTFYGQLASAGGTARTATCNPQENVSLENICHFQVTPGQKTPQQLTEDATNAINQIRQNISSCDFKVQAPPSGFQLDSHTISVRYKAPNGAMSLVLPGVNDGWSVDNADKPQTVRLNGAACKTYKEQGGSVEVLLACK